MKFSALNVDFNGTSLDLLGQSFVKTVADTQGQATYHKKH